MRHPSKTLFAVFAVLALTGCSATKWTHTAYDGSPTQVAEAADEEAYTVGVGEQVSFESESDGRPAPTTQAGVSQTYYFDFDQSQIHTIDKRSIDAQARYLISHPNARILLAGHTDERGSREYNVALGERRAKRIAQILKTDGVPSKQIRLISYGEEKPAAYQHNEHDYALNRRVKLTYERT